MATISSLLTELSLKPTPSCVHVCEKGYNNTYKKDKHFGASAYTISSDVQQIQAEILKNGPVEADFTVYSDFVNYKSGQSLITDHCLKFLNA